MTGEGGWRRFHPLSPLLRGGVAVLAVASWAFSQQLDRIFGSDPQDPTGGHPLIAVAAGVAVLAAIVLAGWASWSVTRFRLGATSLELRSGLLFRQHRQVRYDRIQAVDLVRPVLARLAGLSEVRVESAGGRDSNVRLAFLADEGARALRDELAVLAGRTDEASEDDGPAEPPVAAEQEAPDGPAPGPGAAEASRALRIPNARLVQSLLYSRTTVFLVVAVPVLVLGFALGWVGVVSSIGPVTLAVGGRHVGAALRWANFELTPSRDVVRLRHGLTDLRTSSIPLHRIQAVGLSQPLPWRPTDWWRMEVNVAGVGTGGASARTETTVLPVGTTAEALAVLSVLLPGTDPAVVVEGMTGSGPGGRFTCSPPGARLLDPLGWRRTGYAVTPRAVVTRRGALGRVVQVVPHARTQSLALRRGPLQRWAGLASVRLVSTPGPVSPVVAHLGEREATDLLVEQMARSRRARAPAPRNTPDESPRSLAERRQT